MPLSASVASLPPDCLDSHLRRGAPTPVGNHPSPQPPSRRPVSLLGGQFVVQRLLSMRAAPPTQEPLLIEPDTHQRQELIHVHRLRYVVRSPRRNRLLAIALHRLGSQRHYRQLLELRHAADGPR